MAYRLPVCAVLRTLNRFDSIYAVVFLLGLFSHLCSTAASAASDGASAEFDDFDEFDAEFETQDTSKHKAAGEPPPTQQQQQQQNDGGGREEKAPQQNEFDVELEEDGDVDEEVVEMLKLQQEDEFFDDDEEFERVVPGRAAPQKSEDEDVVPTPKTDDALPQLKITDVPAHLRNNWVNYQLEWLMLAGLAVYMLNYAIGKSKNQSLANAWYEQNKEQLTQNFAVVGDDGTEKDNPSTDVFMADCDNQYSLWCSGRVGCDSLFAQLRLLKRQDLVSTISYIFKPQFDQLLVKVVMTPAEMDSFVFACGKRKAITKLTKEMTDVGSFCSERKVADNYGLPAALVVLSELGEATTHMLDTKIVSVLTRHEECIEYIYFSDQHCGPLAADQEVQSKLPEPEKVLLFRFNIPGKSGCNEAHLERIKPLLSIVFYYIDKVRRFNLSREGKAKAEKKRHELARSFLRNTHAARAEAAQNRREERIRERKEKMMNEEDPDRQRRLEKQEQKREARRNQPRVKQLKIKAA